MSTAKPTVTLAIQPLYVARQEAAATLSISETTLEALVAKSHASLPDTRLHDAHWYPHSTATPTLPNALQRRCRVA